MLNAHVTRRGLLGGILAAIGLASVPRLRRVLTQTSADEIIDLRWISEPCAMVAGDRLCVFRGREEKNLAELRADRTMTVTRVAIHRSGLVTLVDDLGDHYSGGTVPAGWTVKDGETLQ